MDILSTPDFLLAAKRRADIDFDRGDEEHRAAWLQAISTLLVRAHERGDGIAVYENSDLGHPELGQWKVVSYGGADAQLETRVGNYEGDNSTDLGGSRTFVHGEDVLPKTLPNIGGQINWRYTLKLVCPADATVLVLTSAAKRRLYNALNEPADLVTVSIPRAAANALAEAWENGDSYDALVVPLRDTFNGQDGFLHTLNEALGREH